MSPEAEIRNWILENSSTDLQQTTYSDDDPLIPKGVLDSLGIMNLVNWIEQRYDFGIAENDFDIQNFETISRIAAFVRKNAPGRAVG